MATPLKRRIAAAVTEEMDRKVRETVEGILADVKKRGDAAVREYSEKFDKWVPRKLSKGEIEAIVARVSPSTISDIQFAQAQIRNFAEHQRAAIRDIEVETLPGVKLGHKNIPVESVGCYVPGGRYPMVASAHMSIVTARAAGVKRIIACTPPNQGEPHAETIAAMVLGGADEIHVLGGVQAIAAMALGTETIAAGRHAVRAGECLRRRGEAPALRPRRHRPLCRPDRDPGDRRRNRGCRDDRHRPPRPGRARPDQPRDLHHYFGVHCRSLPAEIERQLKVLPTADVAGVAWRDYGEIILVDSREEAVKEADRIAAEHVEILFKDPRYFLQNMRNYGALFLGPETNVSYGDKVIGTNHTLPTLGAARYSGGLWVGKFLKTCTYQEITREASVAVGEYCSRLCAIERFWGHKEQADLRLRRYGGQNVGLGAKKDSALAR